MWDTDYGNYGDITRAYDEHIKSLEDFFRSTREQRAAARQKFDDALKDVLLDIAYDVGLGQMAEDWTDDEWDEFREEMDL